MASVVFVIKYMWWDPTVCQHETRGISDLFCLGSQTQDIGGGGPSHRDSVGVTSVPTFHHKSATSQGGLAGCPEK